MCETGSKSVSSLVYLERILCTLPRVTSAGLGRLLEAQWRC